MREEIYNEEETNAFYIVKCIRVTYDTKIVFTELRRHADDYVPYKNNHRYRSDEDDGQFIVSISYDGEKLIDEFVFCNVSFEEKYGRQFTKIFIEILNNIGHPNMRENFVDKLLNKYISERHTNFFITKYINHITVKGERVYRDNKYDCEYAILSESSLLHMHRRPPIGSVMYRESFLNNLTSYHIKNMDDASLPMVLRDKLDFYGWSEKDKFDHLNHQISSNNFL